MCPLEGGVGARKSDRDDQATAVAGFGMDVAVVRAGDGSDDRQAEARALRASGPVRGVPGERLEESDRQSAECECLSHRPDPSRADRQLVSQGRTPRPAADGRRDLADGTWLNKATERYPAVVLGSAAARRLRTGVGLTALILAVFVPTA